MFTIHRNPQLWGSVQSHKFLCDGVVLSDDAGQFNVGRHALCWVHAERLVHKLDTFTDIRLCRASVGRPSGPAVAGERKLHMTLCSRKFAGRTLTD